MLAKVVCASAAALLLAAGAARGEEPARQFLDGLRERGYHDVALEYLQRMKDNPLAPVELREIYLYEQGATLIEASREQRDMAIRATQLDEAQSSLQQFIRGQTFSFSAPLVDPTPPNPLPPAAQRANSFFAFDSNGQPIAASSIGASGVSAGASRPTSVRRPPSVGADGAPQPARNVSVTARHHRIGRLNHG